MYTHLVPYAFQGLGWLSNQHVHTRRKQHKPVVVLIFLIFLAFFLSCFVYSSSLFSHHRHHDNNQLTQHIQLTLADIPVNSTHIH